MIGCRMSVAATVATCLLRVEFTRRGWILGIPPAVSGLRWLATCIPHNLDELPVRQCDQSSEEGSDVKMKLSTAIRFPGHVGLFGS